MQIFKKLFAYQKACYLLALGIFWISNAVFSYQNGNKAYFHTDETGEQFSIHAAKHYVEHGFFENYLLPTYPPFGADPEGKLRDKPFVYTHYLAGQDLILGLWLKVFGYDALWSARLIPLTLTVLAMAYVSLQFGAYIGSALMGCAFLLLLLVPRALTSWAICVYGHSYVMAVYLFLFGFILKMAQPDSKLSPTRILLTGATVGLLQMFFDLDWVPLTFIGALASCLLVLKMEVRNSCTLLLGIFLGGCVAAIYQVTLTALYYHSLSFVLGDLFHWASWRAGAVSIPVTEIGNEPIDTRLHRILHEFNRSAYGAINYTASNAAELALFFVGLGKLSKILTKNQTLRFISAVIMSYLASASWSIVMRQHAWVHMRFINRHYIVLFIAFIFITLSVSYDLVRRAQSWTPNAESK